MKRLILFALPLAIWAAEPGFDVASIKQSQGDAGFRIQIEPNGRLTLRNISLTVVIGIAYDLPINIPKGRLSGGPEWVRSDRFDIDAVATIPQGLSARERQDREIRPRLRTLLKERFQLALRTENAPQAVYAIRTGKNGPKLTASGLTEKECAGRDTSAETACHVFQGGQGRGLHASAAGIADLAKFIESWTDRPVVDQSGVAGLYRFDTQGWAPLVAAPKSADDARTEAGGLQSDQLSLFEVLETLGLRLVADRAPVTSYVIESVSKPGEN